MTQKPLLAVLMLTISSMGYGQELDAQSPTAQNLPPAATSAVDFLKDVRPILEQHCWSCHGRELQESGLRLDQRRSLLEGGDQGRAIVPGRSGDSRLIHLVSGLDADMVMPPEGNRLTATEIGLLRAWIDEGASWADSAPDEQPEDNHWAYQPLKAVPPPSVTFSDWPGGAIDRFILAELEQRGIQPSAEADRNTLIRRLSLDLTGLLPAVSEMDEFLNDAGSDAYETLVDRLVASPHFGERWGRHWLDVARYADSDGYEKDNPRPDAWRWRDWVIDAINADLPFDQFTIEQLAGDLLPDATPMQRLATAFHRQTLTNTEGGTDQEQFRVEACFDRTETTGTVWLGLTVGCARCHSHKYDRISQREYYQLFAFFNNSDEQTTVVPKSSAEIAAYPQLRAAYDERLAAIDASISAVRQQTSAEFDGWLKQQYQQADDSLSDDLRKLLRTAAEKLTISQQDQLWAHFGRQHAAAKKVLAELDMVKKQEPPRPELSVRVISQRQQDLRPTYVLKRGEFLDPIPELQMLPGGLSTLPPLSARKSAESADRLDLAYWLVSKHNPLTPRVTVNQIWRLLFGNGLVRTPGDFGVRGERPTHPQLLDWLAADFVGRTEPSEPMPNTVAWSRKALIRRIVLSATYRQSSQHRSELLDVDPQNLWLARQNRLRVEAEIVRDISLDAAGLLSRRIGGPSVYPPLPPGIAELSYAGNFKWQNSTGEDRYRRGMYTFFKRTAPHPNLITFDCPDANLTCVERQSSNTPLQALTSLNNETFAEAARAFAGRILQLESGDDRSRLAEAFRICLARPAESVELQALQELLSDAQSWYQQHPEQAAELIEGTALDGISADRQASWTAAARILLNLDEFITRE